MTAAWIAPSLTISLTINRPCDEVYRFLSRPANLSRWTAVAFKARLVQVGETEWQAIHEDRVVTLRFTPENALGVIDLQVSGRAGSDRCYFARVFPNGSGTELCCTVLQAMDESDAEFASEAEWLRTDLMVLKSFFEAR